MKFRLFIYSIASILCVSLVGCGNTSSSESNVTTSEVPLYTENNTQDDSVTTSEVPLYTKETWYIDPNDYVMGEFPLSDTTKKFFFGKWKVKKLLGFGDSWNDASEYPNGQDIIGNELIIMPDIYSTLGLEKYENYQESYNNPYYYVSHVYNNLTNFYRQWKFQIPGLEDYENDTLEVIEVAPNTNEMWTTVFFCLNNEKLFYLLEATIFELEKIEGA